MSLIVILRPILLFRPEAPPPGEEKVHLCGAEGGTRSGDGR